jgi:hypothetical protein
MTHENYWNLTDFQDQKESVKSLESVAFFLKQELHGELGERPLFPKVDKD